MNFEIKFTSKDGYPIYKTTENIGVAHVDFIRAETGVANLSLDRMQGHISSVIGGHNIPISEHLARKSGHFEFDYLVKIKGDSAFLNKYLQKEVQFRKNDTTGEVEYAWIKWSFNTHYFLNVWEEAGFPLDMTVE